MYSEAVTFNGGEGEPVSGRLEHPVGRFVGWALFAHCFTCSKQSRAAVAVSRGLAERGIGVLRFDFTGIGESGGDFAETSFTTNVSDIRAAATWMAEQGRPVSLLVGHSLGGSAALVSAGAVEGLKAVATIGAPAETGHAIRQFDGHVDTIETKGQAEVVLGGRTFPVRRQMLEDLRTADVSKAIETLRLPVLLLHAPGDSVVGIENATELFVAARHPKSFVSLDDADHFLQREEDTDFAASVIAGWAGRYLLPDTQTDTDASGFDVTVSETAGTGPYQNEVKTRGFRQIIDEPRDLGGSDTGPDPYSLLSAALGGCTSITLRMYADRKGLPLDHVSVGVTHERDHAKDCETCGPEDKVDVFTRSISLRGALADAETERLLEIAERCPVHKTLEKTSVIRSQISHKTITGEGSS